MKCMPITAVKYSLIALPRLSKRLMAICLDLITCFCTVWLALVLSLGHWVEVGWQYGWAYFFAIFFSLPLFVKFGLYRAIFRYVEAAAFASMALVFLIYTGLYFFVFTLVGVDSVPRSIGIIQPLLLFNLIGCSRYMVRYWLGGMSSKKLKSSRLKSVVLIYGAGSAGRQLANALSANGDFLIKGFVDDSELLHGSTINDFPVYPGGDLKELINRFEVTDVLLAISSKNQKKRTQIIVSLEGCGVRVRTLPNLLDMASGQINISDLQDLDVNDLLGREAITPNVELLKKNIQDKRVLITGAGGSIGSELCRQIIQLSPQSIILIENNEHALYTIYEELKKIIANQEAVVKSEFDTNINITAGKGNLIEVIPCLASVRDKDLMRHIFSREQPETVFHAAAYKHVPLVEINPTEAIHNNIFGTLNCVQVSMETGVSHFTLISTDKAVRPTNIMGLTKRISELILQACSQNNQHNSHETIFSIVRFGNVLGSSGSVVPLFKSQINEGGPITLTHREVTRYFMSIPEAAQLVIQASSMAVGGDVFVLDMGRPVCIYDLAVKMIHLSGLVLKDEFNPHGDIEIKVTGLRAGEKLYEELLIGNEPMPTGHSGIMKAHEKFSPWPKLNNDLENLMQIALGESGNDFFDLLQRLIPEYPFSN